MAKIEEVSLFDVIGEKKEKYEYSFITTFNAYLPFYEQIVLRRLIKAGCRVNTLLIDAGQFAGCLTDFAGKPQSAGRDYTLIPIDSGNGVFHPKVLLLLGKENAALCVGSHNLTLSGFGKNRELTTLFEVNSNSSSQERKIFQDAWKTLRLWSANQPEELMDSFLFVEKEIEWLTNAVDVIEKDSALFFGASETGLSLWEQVGPILPNQVQKVTMISPFFDEELRFLREISDRLSPKEFIVGIEPRSVHLAPKAQSIFPNIKFVNAEKLRSNRGYLHAKAIYLETESDENVFITGSANMSSPAWLNVNRRNCESVIVLRSKEANAAIKAIGLDELAKTPKITDSDWQLIEKNKLNRTELFSEKEKKTLLTAIETETGFIIVLKNAQPQFDKTVEFINAIGEIIYQGEITNFLNEEVFIEVPDSQIRFLTNTIKLNSASGEIITAFVHHTPTIISKFNKSQHRDFFAGLESFDIPIDNKFWRLFEQIVFDEGNKLPDYMEAGISIRHETDNLEVNLGDSVSLQETFSIKTADIGFKDRLNQNSLDSLSELIGLLNRRLYSPSKATQSFSLPFVGNDYELAESEEYETEEIIDPKFEIEQIASHYNQRTRTMMRRMSKKLDSLKTTEINAQFAALRQITVVLGILHWIRQLEKTEKFASCENHLISIDDEWKLFVSANCFFAKLQNVVPEVSLQSLPFADIYSTIVGNLVWLGFDCDFDIAKLLELRQQNYGEERSDGWTTNEVLEGTACFLKLAVPFCNNQQAQTTFEKLMENYDISDWIERNMAWLKLINRTSKDFSTLPILKRKVQIGDLVFQTKMKKPEILVVSNNPGFIEIVILNAEDRRKKYSAETVAVIEI